MRLHSTALLFVTLAAAPVFCQNVQTNVASASAAVSTLPSDNKTASPSGTYVSLREDLAQKNKALVDQRNMQKAILKKNQDLLKDAQKINAANLKLADEQKKLAAADAELEKQRESLKMAQKPVEVAAK